MNSTNINLTQDSVYGIDHDLHRLDCKMDFALNDADSLSSALGKSKLTAKLISPNGNILILIDDVKINTLAEFACQKGAFTHFNSTKKTAYFSILIGDKGNLKISKNAELELEFSELQQNRPIVIDTVSSFVTSKNVLQYQTKNIETSTNLNVHVKDVDYLTVDEYDKIDTVNKQLINNKAQFFDANSILKDIDVSRRIYSVRFGELMTSSVIPMHYQGVKVKTLNLKVNADTFLTMVKSQKYL